MYVFLHVFIAKYVVLLLFAMIRSILVKLVLVICIATGTIFNQSSKLKIIKEI